MIEFLFSFKGPDPLGPGFGEIWQIFGAFGSPMDVPKKKMHTYKECKEATLAKQRAPKSAN